MASPAAGLSQRQQHSAAVRGLLSPALEVGGRTDRSPAVRGDFRGGVRGPLVTIRSHDCGIAVGLGPVSSKEFACQLHRGLRLRPPPSYQTGRHVPISRRLPNRRRLSASASAFPPSDSSQDGGRTGGRKAEEGFISDRTSPSGSTGEETKSVETGAAPAPTSATSAPAAATSAATRIPAAKQSSELSTSTASATSPESISTRSSSSSSSSSSSADGFTAGAVDSPESEAARISESSGLSLHQVRIALALQQLLPWNLVKALWQWVLSWKLVRFVLNYPAWQQRKRLQQLREAADASPKDAAKQAEYLQELNKVDCQAVVDRFERREHATDAAVVVEYLRALVATGAIAEYLPDDSTGRASGLPHLLQELKQRSVGDLDELLAPPGMTEQVPLHVVMVEGKQRSASSRGLRILQEIVSTIFVFVLFSVFWVLAATALRRYVAGVSGMTGAASSGAGGPAGMGTAGVYAPKEYNKENMPEKSVKTFKDVKGCDEAKAELEEIVQYLKNPTKFTRLGGKLPKGVLLIGPPGTGKTLLAKAIAGEAGVPFFYRAGSEFEEMFVGVGARRVRALFQAAKKKGPCIVFIDEIDAVGGSRKQWEGHTKKTLNQLLVEMDGFEANEGIIVIAATNLPEMLDPALTRPGRFDRHVVVSNPDIRGRQEILELYLKDKPMEESVNVKTLARGTPGFSGADLANLVNMAAVKAALDGRDKISLQQLEFAKDKILMGAERKSMAVSDECRKNTAYHEGGHALVALHTPGAMPIHKATIMPRGMALGMVTQLPDDDYENSRTRTQMLARLDVCMGGRVAEELVFGPAHVTSGARDDLKQATRMARHMVMECGFSDKIGPVFLEPGSEKYSGETMRMSEAEVVRLLKEAYERVRKLLKEHEQDLHLLAAALMEKETLTASEIKEVLEGSKAPSAAAAEVPTLDTGFDPSTVPAAAALL